MRFIKINKPTARKIFNKGRIIYLIPSRARINGMWIHPFAVSKRRGSFDKVVNNFEYYNCHAPFGKYAWFYKKVQ